MAHPGGGPQVLEQLHKSLAYTVYDAKWVPCSAKLVALGSLPRDTGTLQVYELEGPALKLLAEAERPQGLKCGGFGASSLADRHLAAGDLGGGLAMFDLERLEAGPLFRVQAHRGVVNALDAFGGQSRGHGAPEIVTAGRDGGVRVWDPRQPDAPVAAFVPAEGSTLRDCWCVAVGNSFSDEERCVLAGYDNGDVKMFDLRTNTVRWEANLGNGVCGVQFDRRDIPMNKFVATCLESSLTVFDARTQHPTKGFAHCTDKLSQGATLWSAQHLPQNRDVFMVGAGDGSLSLYKYHYPDQRVVKQEGGVAQGVVGKLELVADKTLSSQPVAAFDWHPDKAGLFVSAAFDQCLRVGLVTKLHSL